ncbi:AMP-binding protein [Halomonas sp. HNIBRBA4712]|uniref:AMP-binding protein n=1 Tax=Halomonas sp. HNIBRBA4712 TaxID=3373087 RepID=UPI003744B606
MSEHADAYILNGPELEGLDQYDSVVDVFNQAVKRYPDRPAFSCMGQTLSFAELDRHAARFASWVQNETNLEPGDRIAIQLPNVLQFPVAVFGALRAGLVVVNTNPLYTEREMAHQFKDSGAKAILILANMAHKLDKVLGQTDIEHVVVTELADLHGAPKRWLINAVVKYVKKMVPTYRLPGAVGFRLVMKASEDGFTPVTRAPDDVAALQYTGGTTGRPKGAMLTHTNLIANMLQARAAIGTHLENGSETVIAPLPVYHIYTFTVNCLFLMETGNHSVLITNPRDLPAFVKELSKLKFSAFIGLNTLFNALCQRDDFKALDFSHLKLTISGGMALTKPVAKRWEEVTGCPVAEGYGLTETSPVVSFNPTDDIRLGTIGKPVAGTAVKTVDADGNDVALGEPGELCVKGPQVMKGYWNQDEETKKSIDDGGWFHTGDIAVLEEDGYIRIVDRKKDMILISGFNVYPNEIEDVVAGHPDIVEAAAVGVPDDNAGEAIKLFVVAKNANLDAETLRAWCKKELTAYKVPKYIEFRDELPKTNVGKVLRRELRDEEKSDASKENA